MEQMYPRLTILHERGYCVLKDARIVRTYHYAGQPSDWHAVAGEVVAGGTMIDQKAWVHAPIGEQQCWDIYGCPIRHETANEYVVTTNSH